MKLTYLLPLLAAQAMAQVQDVQSVLQATDKFRMTAENLQVDTQIDRSQVERLASSTRAHNGCRPLQGFPGEGVKAFVLPGQKESDFVWLHQEIHRD